MLDKPNEPDDAGVTRRREASENAVHSLRMEGRKLDPDTVPEYGAVIAGTMSFDDAARSIAERYRKA